MKVRHLVPVALFALAASAFAQTTLNVVTAGDQNMNGCNNLLICVTFVQNLRV